MYTLSLLPNENNDLYNHYHKTRYIGDCGIDLFIPNDIIVPANARSFMINHDIMCAMSPVINDHSIECFVSYYLYPRSSISKTPLRMCNSVGIIDSGYRGNIIAMVDNHSDQDYYLKKGERLFQICSPTLQLTVLKLVKNLPSSDRGTGGFGSTGK